MRTRTEIKEHAKLVFAAQRGNSILALFLVSLITGGSAMFFSIYSIYNSFNILLGEGPPSVAVIPISFLVWLISIAVSLLILVLTVNVGGTFIKVYYCQLISVAEPFSELKNNFIRKLGGMMWMYLWVYLWTLLFIIPGIIKSFAYSMTPYILASSPNVTATDALKLSMRMTDGHKGKIFVMGLSFIGWNILNAFTFGILGIFFVNPYETTAFAGLFVELRGLAVANGVIHPAELDGVDPYSRNYQQYPQHLQYQQYPQYPQYPQQPPEQPHFSNPYQQQSVYMQHPQYPNVQLYTAYPQEIPPASQIPQGPLPRVMYQQPSALEPYPPPPQLPPETDTPPPLSMPQETDTQLPLPPQPAAFQHIEMPQQPTLPEVPKPPEPPRLP